MTRSRTHASKDSSPLACVCGSKRRNRRPSDSTFGLDLQTPPSDSTFGLDLRTRPSDSTFGLDLRTRPSDSTFGSGSH
eukprot:scaffold688_cov34-Phaeocystis_antarctica.AAC.1